MKAKIKMIFEKNLKMVNSDNSLNLVQSDCWAHESFICNCTEISKGIMSFIILNIHLYSKIGYSCLIGYFAAILVYIVDNLTRDWRTRSQLTVKMLGD